MDTKIKLSTQKYNTKTSLTSLDVWDNQNIVSSVQLDIPTLTGVYYRILHIIFFVKRQNYLEYKASIQGPNSFPVVPCDMPIRENYSRHYRS